MMKKFSTYWLALGVVIFLTLWLATGDVQQLKSESPEFDADRASEGVMKVAFRYGESAPVLQQLPIQGQLEAWREVEVSARITGVVERLPVAKGERVKEGEPLVFLSEEDRPSQVRKAEAEVTLAESQLKATQSLAQRNLAADTDLKAKQAALAQAQAELAKLKQALNDTVVKAPFSGVMETLPVEIGQTVQPGTPLTRIVDDSRLKMVGQVPQQRVAALRIGQKVTARLLDGQQLEGELTFISAQADANTRSYRIEATLDNPERLRLAGATATLAVELGEVLAHAISPALLSLDRQGRLSVEHVGDDGRIVQTPVERVRITPDAIWVTGLPEQVRIVTMGRGFVTPGTKVEAVEETSLTAGADTNG